VSRASTHTHTHARARITTTQVSARATHTERTHTCHDTVNLSESLRACVRIIHRHAMQTPHVTTAVASLRNISVSAEEQQRQLYVRVGIPASHERQRLGGH
jgi:hypothetical protein